MNKEYLRFECDNPCVTKTMQSVCRSILLPSLMFSHYPSPLKGNNRILKKRTPFRFRFFAVYKHEQ